jgi:predicted kinase
VIPNALVMEAIIFCGIQGSGKSTFFLQNFYHTHVRLNLNSSSEYRKCLTPRP